ncbi:MraY family glycosyltransferase [Thiohalobacter sp. IOR34]|uniref:glycosyltransferase family 4 protein n=1 Tax=Thiohalobacter sp. IOR34 TaxID=3057176 RepID=UPI0025B250FF|nr:MraY family glycosyltransferase [Thiohalobacter sp. IOR34]WJW75292.1 MraY family glycosyltransferase [Thiohalobacter sp. IOR34]
MNAQLSNFLFIFIAAMAISMAIIPLMFRIAPRIGMIDKPDARKVHAVPIPRVGGVGIVIGALVPMLILLPVDATIGAYLFGAIVLLIFGVWDDACELGHYVKFIGQFIASLAVVYYGDLHVSYLPFMDMEPVPESFGKPFTVIAIVGMINAINHSDGLDGLAGGESLLSLGAITYLAHLAGGTSVVIIAVATIGGIFGFLRFNSHPAKVFMGDGGSQFLGFTLGVLAVMLTQKVNPALSPALPALFLGLPIADILSVFAQRIYHRLNWFRATKNHIHHRLLELGFHHYESVIIIYSIQAFFVIAAVLLPYESDALILGVYLGVCSLLFAMLVAAEKSGWHAHHGDGTGRIARMLGTLRKNHVFVRVPHRVTEIGLSLFLVGSAFMATNVPRDFGWSAGVLFGLLLLRLLFGYHLWFLFLRLIIYVALGFAVYLLNSYPPGWLLDADFLVYLYFGVLVVAFGLGVRYAEQKKFQVTPLDYLVLIIIMIVGLISGGEIGNSRWVMLVVQLIILFYASEFVMQQMRNRWNAFTGSVLASLAVFALRGFAM